jgi:RND family efflux transporter MFP subunit
LEAGALTRTDKSGTRAVETRSGRCRSAAAVGLATILTLSLSLSLTLTGTGCQQQAGNAAPAGKAGSAPAKPAKLEGTPKEADLATVTLTPEAETRLGLATGPVEKKPVPKVAIYAGEVTVPPGRLIAVTSPFVGLVRAPAGATLPSPGATVKEGQPVCALVPVLSPEARATIAPLRIDAENQVKTTKDQLHIAKVALDRAENLVRDKLGGAAALIDAKANYDLAYTNTKAAEARRETIERVAADAESGTMNVQTVKSPASGVLQNVHALPGQVVAAGAALFEVSSLDPVWVKVPIYVGEVRRLAADRPAEIGGLSDSPGAPGSLPGKPVAAPPTGNALAATVDIYYEVANRDGGLRPGERVGVTLPLKGEDTSTTVPRASLIRDIHGGAWVYEKIGDHKYARRRVLVDRVAGPVAVLTFGPKPGGTVVTDGAAELYGAEFGGGT